jgi:anti-sigma B factor antagonist
MPIEDWSDRIVIAHLAAEPHFSDDLQTIQDRAAQRPIDVVLDLAGVRYLNSSNIARLLKVRKVIATAGNRLVLCGVDAQVWGAFLVTGLDKVFDFSDSVSTALATLQLSRA